MMKDDPKNNAVPDLGSAPKDDFDPFADDDDLGEATDDNAEQQPSPQQTPQVTQPSTTMKVVNSKVTPTTATSATPTTESNPLDAAISAAENQDAEQAKQSVVEKAPVFEYAGATENIGDTSKTFDELRIEKATDFPELDDGKRVSWTVEYGKVNRVIADPKGTSIGKVKTEIETSKEFVDGLKKSKDKSPACKVKPRVTAQSKGVSAVPQYKGVFANLDEADAAGKTISIVPARDGKVYEIRNTKMGRFTTPITNCDLLSNVRAGFIPALPPIPQRLLMQIVEFFRYFTRHGADNEALLNIFWDTLNHEYVVDAPEQTVTNVSVESRENPDFAGERYIHVMDIHSHNSMKAFFSPIDDADEKATRLYAVVGQLYKYIPDIKVRLSNGGKFLEIEPSEVFELIGEPFPEVWRERVRFRSPHSDDGGTDNDVPWRTDDCA